MYQKVKRCCLKRQIEQHDAPEFLARQTGIETAGLSNGIRRALGCGGDILFAGVNCRGLGFSSSKACLERVLCLVGEQLCKTIE